MLSLEVIKSRGKSMAVVIETPKELEEADTVLMFCHGFVGHKITPHRMAPNLSHKLLEKGITTVRFDCVGAGDSEGNEEYMTIPGEVEDAVVVTNFIREKLKPKKLFILGYSMGGTVATLTASRVNPDGLLLWSPVSDPYWNFYHILGSERFERGLRGEDVSIDGDYVSKNFFLGLEKIKPLELVKELDIPVRIIHGEQDQDVLPINGVSYNLFSKDSKLHFVEGADHCYSDVKYQEELLQVTEDYLIELLNK